MILIKAEFRSSAPLNAPNSLLVSCSRKIPIVYLAFSSTLGVVKVIIAAFPLAFRGSEHSLTIGADTPNLLHRSFTAVETHSIMSC
jgi:hypothetical protein